MVTGMHASTGRSITGTAHLRQSIADILVTPLGSRVMRRNYGSCLFDLIDHAANDAGRLRVIAATVDALIRWEPRLKLDKVTIDGAVDGATTIRISGLYNGAETAIALPLGDRNAHGAIQ